MYQRFTVDKFLLHANREEIILTFTLDVDDETINTSTVYITESKEGMQPILLPSSSVSYTVDGRAVKIKYTDLKVNSPYEIHVTSGVESILGENLEVEFVKEFELPSGIDSTVEIIAPADYENIDALELRLKETAGPTKKLFNAFNVQVASDVNFLDVILDTNVDGKTEATFSELKQESQYFLRVRPYEGTAFGNWSAPITFTRIKKSTTQNGGADDNTQDNTDDDDWMPEVIEDMELLTKPENGVTPQSFLFEFDSDLDEENIQASDIIVTMRKV